MNRLQPIILPGMIVFFLLGILLALGSWQLDRLVEKEALIARAHERPALPVIDLPGVGEWEAFSGRSDDPLVYRRVRVSGTYEGPTLRVFTVLSEPRGSYEGPGYWLVTPFRLADGEGLVLVNRGFVPDARMSDGVGAYLPPQGPQTLEAIVRESDLPSFTTPMPEPANDLYFRRDVNQIVEGEALEGKVAPFTLDLVADRDAPAGTLPQAGETKVSFFNNHLSYALTWFGLAAVLVAVFIPFAIGRVRQEG